MEGIFLHLNIYNVSNPDSFKYINKKMHKPENNKKKFLQPFLTTVLRIRVILYGSGSRQQLIQYKDYLKGG